MELGNEELYCLHASSNIRVNKSRRTGWAGHVLHVEGTGGDYRVLMEIPKGKRPSGRLRRNWECNIKTDIQEVALEGRDWVDLAQDRNRWRALLRKDYDPRSQFSTKFAS